MRGASIFWFLFSTGGVVVAVLVGVVWIFARPKSRVARAFLGCIAVGYVLVSMYAVSHAVERWIAAPFRPVAVLALSPQGRQLTQEVVEELAGEERLTLLSSRFEGFDERIAMHLASDAISIGPYVLSGGELPAMVLLDAVARRLPGALGSEESGLVESFSPELEGGLEYPHYTRPAEFHGWRVPDVLLSGDHGRIDEWRKEQSRLRTRS